MVGFQNLIKKIKNTKLKFDLVNADDGNVVATPDDKLTPRFLKKLKKRFKTHTINDDELLEVILQKILLTLLLEKCFV